MRATITGSYFSFNHIDQQCTQTIIYGLNLKEVHGGSGSYLSPAQKIACSASHKHPYASLTSTRIGLRSFTEPKGLKKCRQKNIYFKVQHLHLLYLMSSNNVYT